MAPVNRDPDVTRYLNLPVDEQAVDAFFGVVSAHWDEHGFGFWALESRELSSQGRFLGSSAWRTRRSHPSWPRDLSSAGGLVDRRGDGGWPRKPP